jgi:hypothetical protein
VADFTRSGIRSFPAPQVGGEVRQVLDCVASPLAAFECGGFQAKNQALAAPPEDREKAGG